MILKHIDMFEGQRPERVVDVLVTLLEDPNVDIQMMALREIWTNDEATFHGEFENFDAVGLWRVLSMIRVQSSLMKMERNTRETGKTMSCQAMVPIFGVAATNT